MASFGTFWRSWRFLELLGIFWNLLVLLALLALFGASWNYMVFFGASLSFLALVGALGTFWRKNSKSATDRTYLLTLYVETDSKK